MLWEGLFLVQNRLCPAVPVINSVVTSWLLFPSTPMLCRDFFCPYPSPTFLTRSQTYEFLIMQAIYLSRLNDTVLDTPLCPKVEATLVTIIKVCTALQIWHPHQVPYTLVYCTSKFAFRYSKRGLLLPKMPILLTAAPTSYPLCAHHTGYQQVYPHCSHRWRWSHVFACVLLIAWNWKIYIKGTVVINYCWENGTSGPLCWYFAKWILCWKRRFSITCNG
jgi:hypothetical protein